MASSKSVTRAVTLLVLLAGPPSQARAADPPPTPNTLPPPTLVTVKALDLSTADAFATLLSEGGLSLEGRSRSLLIARHQGLVLDLSERPFWPAVKELCDYAKVDVEEVSEAGAVRLRDAANPPGAQPWSIKGPAALLITTVDARRSLNFLPHRGPTPDNTFMFSVRALAEPAFKPRLYRVERIEQTVTDTGEPLTHHVQMFGTRYFPATAWRQNAFTLQAPKAIQGKRIPKLSVTVRYVMELRTRTLEIPNILQAAGSEHDVGNFKFKVAEAVASQQGRYKFTLELYRSGRPPEEWREFDDLIVQPSPRIVDAQGRPLRSIGGGGGGNNDSRRYEQTVSSDPVGPAANAPDKLIWEYPVGAKTLDVKFEFTDVPIP